jgi:hypothetical protein
MANPTSNFNWQMPTNTDLVKDLPADFEVFGQAVDTSLADLKGGTSGQILSKNSNTDMDFVWINNDQGDITAVNVTSPITGGGSAGAVTVGIQDGTTAQKGAVQLENSTSSTSTTTAAVPASVKSAYDLANAAIPKSIVDAAGDVIYATANDTVTRLGIGTAGQVLSVNSGATAPEWKTISTSPTFVGCSVYANNHQTISTATFTDLTWNTEIFDTDGFHSTTTNTARMTIPSGKDGYYRVTCRAYWNAASATGQRTVSIFKNGTRWNNGTQPGDTVAGPAVTTSQIINLVAGDYITMAVYQNSGGNMDIYRIDDPGTGGYQSQFEIQFLGA